jgi:hypothetical protein
MISEAKLEVKMLAKIGYELYHASLNGACMAHGHIGGNARRRWERMEHPIPGDLVIELSTAGWWLHCDDSHPGPYDYLKVENAIGFLEKVAQEPVQEWDEKENEEPAPLETVYYLKLLQNGSTFKWTNARFATILPVEGWPR